MAIIFEGQSTCPICNSALDKNKPYTMFPPFLPNIKDPLYIFNDAAVYEECLEKHPFGNRIFKFIKFIPLSKRTCHVGGNKIAQNDIIYFGCLTTEDDELSEFNFLAFDRNNITKWKDRERFVTVANQYIKDGKWEDWWGNAQYLTNLIDKCLGD